MSRLPTMLVAAALALGALGAAIFSGAGFTAGTSNPGNSFTAAASFCPTPGPVTLPADRDAFVYQLSAGQNFGADTTLQVSPGVLALLVIHRTLIGFDVGSVSPLCSMTAATLRLYATSSSSGRTIGVYQANGAWTEGGVTWSNQPATTGSAATAASGSGLRSWDVTSHVAAMMAGTNNGFLIRDQSEAALLSLRAQVYQSREGTPDGQDPELVLTLE
jgi:hypothetical protein